MEICESAKPSSTNAGVQGRDTTPESLALKASHSLGHGGRLRIGRLSGSTDLGLQRREGVALANDDFWHQRVGRPRSGSPRTRAKSWASWRLRSSRAAPQPMAFGRWAGRRWVFGRGRREGSALSTLGAGGF